MLEQLTAIHLVLSILAMFRRIPSAGQHDLRLALCATFASQSFMAEMKVFDRATKLKQRNRAALQSGYDDYEFIRDHFAEQLVDRLLDIKKEFSVAVDVGCGAGHILKHLPNVGKVGKLIQVDSSSEMLKRCLRYKEQAAEQGIESDV